eukprot:TRINITY_DN6110_c0_g1_i1.p1 TRINITY_DN6110_c0_g1~~TRINITY_DN6110_c0_g1_i1.p1  ORF type:complete len:293 (-),score=39.34 TRINITY_DN6110_c0_g1_i1:218-1096(-)
MACTEEEFGELLGGESIIDLSKLVDASIHGIPQKIRGEVWKYLLEVAKPDKSEEERQKKQQIQEYQESLSGAISNPEIIRNVRNAVKRFKVIGTGGLKVEMDAVAKSKCENILIAFANADPEFDVHPSSISRNLSLLNPFVSALGSESDIYNCYIALMRKIQSQMPISSIPAIVLRFMMYFRTLIPSLYHHFEEEEVSMNDWAMIWFQYLLSSILPFHCLLRLWDTYFAVDIGLGLHTYVCLAILLNCAEELLELENTGIISLLHHLPIMDMDKIIAQAYNIRDEIRANNEL